MSKVNNTGLRWAIRISHKIRPKEDGNFTGANELNKNDYMTLNFKQLILLYFKPKTFEFYRNRPIYEWIGIRIYKKYLPTTGDIVRKKRKIIQINFGKAGKKDELYRYERKTRNYEWRHLIGAAIFVVLTFLLDRKLTVFDWFFLTFLNMYINIYPIFLQRYNRIRIIKVLQSYGLPDPYDSLPAKSVKK